MGKLRAFLTHLGISATVVGLAVGVIFLFWYPQPYFQVIGTWVVLRVLIGVDLVLGPLLTLVVYRAGKPRLLLDLSVIAAIQLTALIYGLTVIYQERPYFAVFAVDRLEILAHKDVDLSSAKDPLLMDKPWRGPIMAVAQIPADPRLRQALLEEVLFQGKPDIERRPEYWAAYDEAVDVVLAKAKPLSELLPAPNPADQEAAERVVASYTERGGAVRYVPVMGKTGPAIFLLDGSTALPVGAAAINPWATP